MSHAHSSSDLPGSPAADRLASAAHETIDRVVPKASRVEHDVRAAAATGADGAKQLQESAAAATEDGLRTARSYIERNPLTTAGIAFALGLLASTLFRR